MARGSGGDVPVIMLTCTKRVASNRRFHVGRLHGRQAVLWDAMDDGIGGTYAAQKGFEKGSRWMTTGTEMPLSVNVRT